MKKTLIALMLTAVLALTLVLPAFAFEGAIAYVYTENGKPLRVRSEPYIADNVIGSLEYGEMVNTISGMASGWTEIYYKDGVAFVQSRFLVDDKPAPKKTTPTVTPVPQKTEEQIAAEEISKQLQSYKTVNEPFYISVRPSRSSGWVNFRVGPSTYSARITTFTEGKQLKVIGETSGWYQAVDVQNNRTGYISKGYVTKIQNPVTTAAGQTQNLGTLNVNGAFNLQCRLPEGYTVQVVNMMGSRLIASINPVSTLQPVLYLSIAYNDLYANVERLNDLSAEDLAVLEQSFRDMNQVDITYGQTAYGTKLMIAREVGSDTDFMDILTVYKGYSIEFVMTPNPGSASKVLTDAQMKMCIDFLSDLDFIPVSEATAQKTTTERKPGSLH